MPGIRGYLVSARGNPRGLQGQLRALLIITGFAAMILALTFSPGGAHALTLNSSTCATANGTWYSAYSICDVRSVITVTPGTTFEIPSGTTLVASGGIIEVEGLSCFPDYLYPPTSGLPDPPVIGHSCNPRGDLQVDSGGVLMLKSTYVDVYGSLVVQAGGLVRTDQPGTLQSITNSSCNSGNYCDSSQATGTIQVPNGALQSISPVVSGVVEISSSNVAGVCLSLDGSFSGTTCTIESGFTVNPGATLKIDPGVTLVGGVLGTANVNIGVNNLGTVINFGTLTGICDTGDGCTGIHNAGILNNSAGATVNGEGDGNGGGLNNNGNIYNFGTIDGPSVGIQNYGNVYNYGGAVFTGSGSSGTFGVKNVGDFYNYGGTLSSTGTGIENLGGPQGPGGLWNTGTISSGGGIPQLLHGLRNHTHRLPHDIQRRHHLQREPG